LSKRNGPNSISAPACGWLITSQSTPYAPTQYTVNQQVTA
jgi:hypothetical protein